MAETILVFHTSRRKTRQIKTITTRQLRIIKGLFHQPVHAPAPFMLSIREHDEAALQFRRGPDVGRIQTPRERILHQLHTDPVQILHDQKILSVDKLLKKLIGGLSLHSRSTSW